MLLYTRLYQFRHGKVVFLTITKKLSSYRIHNHLAITFSVYTIILQMQYSWLSDAIACFTLWNFHLHHEVQHSYNPPATVWTLAWKYFSSIKNIFTLPKSPSQNIFHFELSRRGRFTLPKWNHYILLQRSWLTPTPWNIFSCNSYNDHTAIIQVA